MNCRTNSYYQKLDLLPGFTSRMLDDESINRDLFSDDDSVCAWTSTQWILAARVWSYYHTVVLFVSVSLLTCLFLFVHKFIIDSIVEVVQHFWGWCYVFMQQVKRPGRFQCLKQLRLSISTATISNANEAIWDDFGITDCNNNYWWRTVSK